MNEQEARDAIKVDCEVAGGSRALANNFCGPVFTKCLAEKGSVDAAYAYLSPLVKDEGAP